MSKVLMASVVALILSMLVSVGSVGAEERILGVVVANDTVCHYGPADDFRSWGDPLPIGMQVTILGHQPWKGWTAIAIGPDVGDGCLVEIGTVVPDSEGSGGVLEVIGNTTVVDYVNCRAEPWGQIITVLEPGRVVIEFADGVSDGWQLVGLEATACYVWAAYLDDGSGVSWWWLEWGHPAYCSCGDT